MVWSFQTVHHDLWDYDVASQPLLFTMQRGGRGIPAVAIGSKTGHLFLVDRDNGKPLFPVQERPVPASTAEGEKASPTQPFPVSPPALSPSSCGNRTPGAGTNRNSTGVVSAFACCARRASLRLPALKAH